MKNVNDILEELIALDSPLANMSRNMPYILPDGYFDNLHSNIKQVIMSEYIAGPLFSAGKSMPYDIPGGYFETLPNLMLASAIAEEQVTLLPKTIPYTMPTGYFEQLPVRILSLVKKKGKAIPLTTYTLWHQVRLAAAAVILLTVGLGTYRYYINRQPNTTEAALAALPKDAISNYVQQNIDEFDADMIITNMANNNTAGTGANTNVQAKQLDNEEIIQYLNQTGWNTD